MAREDRGFASVGRVNQRAIASQARCEFDATSALESLLNDLHGDDIQVFGNGTYKGREPGEEQPHHSLRLKDHTRQKTDRL